MSDKIKLLDAWSAAISSQLADAALNDELAHLRESVMRAEVGALVVGRGRYPT